MKTIDELKARVEDLRPILSERQNAWGYLALFDEFLRECELALALSCICDYLLEPGAAHPAPETINRIESLQLAMKLQDDCVDRLRMKSNPKQAEG